MESDYIDNDDDYGTFILCKEESRAVVQEEQDEGMDQFMIREEEEESGLCILCNNHRTDTNNQVNQLLRHTTASTTTLTFFQQQIHKELLKSNHELFNQPKYNNYNSFNNPTTNFCDSCLGQINHLAELYHQLIKFQLEFEQQKLGFVQKCLNHAQCKGSNEEGPRPRSDDKNGIDHGIDADTEEPINVDEMHSCRVNVERFRNFKDESKVDGQSHGSSNQQQQIPQYVPNQKGGHYLSHEGFTFRKRSATSTTSYWLCSKSISHGCKARCKVINGVLDVTMPDHNHPMNPPPKVNRRTSKKVETSTSTSELAKEDLNTHQSCSLASGKSELDNVVNVPPEHLENYERHSEEERDSNDPDYHQDKEPVNFKELAASSSRHKVSRAEEEFKQSTRISTPEPAQNSTNSSNEQLRYEFVKNQLGGLSLLHEGFFYRKKQETSSASYWVCVRNRGHDCKARCLISDGILKHTMPDHNHPVIPPKLKRPKRTNTTSQTKVEPPTSTSKSTGRVIKEIVKPGTSNSPDSGLNKVANEDLENYNSSCSEEDEESDSNDPDYHPEEHVDIKQQPRSLISSSSKEPQRSQYQFVKNQVGGLSLLHEGFSYRKKQETSTVSYWVCGSYKSYGCKARCKLSNGIVELTMPVHNHVKNPPKVKRRRRAPPSKKPLDPGEIHKPQFVKNQVGGLSLLHDGFSYQKKQETPTTSYWVCGRNKTYGCKARCKLSDGIIELTMPNHNHVKNPPKVKRRRPRPPPKPLDPEEIHKPQFVKNQLGGLTLLHEGFKFIKKQVTETTSYWLCIKNKSQGCTARCKISNGHVEITNPLHNHPMNQPKVKTLRRRKPISPEELQRQAERASKTCSDCGASFDRFVLLQIHCRKECHGEARKNQCEICGQCVTSKKSLRLHIARVHTRLKKYHCSICPESFILKDALVRHVATHTGEANFKCSYCEASFNYNIGLRKHLVESHPEEHLISSNKPHACKLCFQNFELQSSLEEHVASSHFTCTVCGKMFRSPSNWRRHCLIHTGEKPHSCSYCGKRFNSRANVSDHERTHTGDKRHRCRDCNEGFTRRKGLQRHVAKAHPELF